MKKLNLQSIKTSVQSLFNVISRYRIVIFVSIITILLSFMLIRISTMATKEPTEQQKQDASAEIKVVKINEDTVKVIKQLQSKDIVIEALFEPGRYDPFTN